MKDIFFSFDIFDTCLVRVCGNPEIVPYILGKEILNNGDEESVLRDFVLGREKAEALAKDKLGKEAVTIEELYSIWDTSLYTNLSKDEIINKEIEIERNLLIPVPSIKRIIEDCRSRGRIVFISDMYLPDYVLRDILKGYGIMQDGDGLYISGTVGVAKDTGRLFQYVKEKENVKYSEWTHYGDNYLSDYVMPKKYGIKTKRISHDYSKIEKGWIKQSIFFREKWKIESMAGLIRALRLQHNIPIDNFVADVMIPTFLPLVYHLLQKAQEDHIDRLYFASRDTYVIFLLAQKLTNVFPEIELKYIHISTKVIYAGCVPNGTEDEIWSVLNLFENVKPRKILEMFGFTKEEIHILSKEMDIEKIYSKCEFSNIVKLLLENNCNVLLKKHSQEKRRNFIGYLQQEAFLSEGRVALFDIGWRCTSQMMMRKIFEKDIKYYYFGVHKARFPMAATGNYTSFSFFEDYNRLGAANFIEYYMCKVLEGSTMGYRVEGESYVPLLEETNFSYEEIEDFNKNLSCLYDALELFKKVPFLIDVVEEILLLSLETLHKTATNPPRETVKFLNERLYSEHYVDKQKSIIKLYPHKILNVLYHIYKKTHKYENLWIEGSIVHTLGKFGTWILKQNPVQKTKKLGMMAKRFKN